MKIYHNSKFLGILKRFIPHRKGDWLNRLIGINLQEDHQGDINVYPVYRSLQIRRDQKGVFVQIPVFNKHFIVLFDASGVHGRIIEISQLQLSDAGTEDEETNE